MHGLDKALLDSGKLDGAAVASLTLEAGGDTTDDDDGVSILDLLGKVVELREPALAELGVQHGELAGTLGILDLDVVRLACLDVEGLGGDGTAETESTACGGSAGNGLVNDLSVDGQDIIAVGGYGIVERAGEIRDETAGDTGRDIIGIDTVGETIATESAEVEGGSIITLCCGLAGELAVVEELHIESLAVIEVTDMVGGGIIVHDLAGLGIEHLGAGNGSLDAFEDGVGMLGGRGSAVVSVKHGGVVGIGTDNGNLLDALGERKDTVVLQHDDGLAGGLAGELVIGFAADDILAEVGPRKVLGRIEHTELEAAHKGTAEMDVEVGLADQAVLEGVEQGYHADTALKVGTGQDGVNGCMLSIRMGAMLVLVVEIVDGVAVRNDQGLIAPLVAEDVGKEPVAGAARLTLIAMVGAHNLLDISLLHEGLESRKVGLPEVTHGNGDIETVTHRFRTAVDSIMLGTSMGLVVLLVITLHALYILDTEDGHQIRVLSVGLLAAAPAGIAEDVDVRAPEGQLGIARIVAGLITDIEDVVVRTVPIGAGLVRYGRENLVDAVGIEGCGHADRLGIHGVSVLTDAVACLAPPVVGRDAEPVDGDGLVHHEADLLLGGEEGDKVLDPLFI